MESYIKYTTYNYKKKIYIQFKTQYTKNIHTLIQNINIQL